MLRPTKPSTAGSSVTDASIVRSTPVAAATASADVRSVPITNSPSTEITTVPPANSTARPAVSMASIDGILRWSCRPASALRYRVTMNSA